MIVHFSKDYWTETLSFFMLEKLVIQQNKFHMLGYSANLSSPLIELTLYNRLSRSSLCFLNQLFFDNSGIFTRLSKSMINFLGEWAILVVNYIRRKFVHLCMADHKWASGYSNDLHNPYLKSDETKLKFEKISQSFLVVFSRRENRN